MAVPIFALTLFVSAFLLFLVQPLIAKAILPWFGGGAGVWTVCMLFFQVLLLAGYAYAHFSTNKLAPRKQVMLHLLVFLLALAALPILPSESWKPRGGENATAHILLLLVASLGVPYFVLAASAPLFQKWFTLSYPGRSPYRLYALSNAGSLAALLSYPFVIEPRVNLTTQASLWGWGFGALVALGALCGWRAWNSHQNPSTTAEETMTGNAELFSTSSRPSFGQRILWLLLPACASLLLLATTNKITQDVAAIPFLWILPLSVYLLTFVICFDSPRWYLRLPVTFLLIASLAVLAWANSGEASLEMRLQILIFTGGLFVCCMACHGELYRLRPGPAYLTEFYLMIAAGGALGGFFVAVIAPLVFNDFYELHLGLALCGLLFLIAVLRGTRSGGEPAEAALARTGRSDYWRTVSCVVPLLAFAGLDQLLSGLGSQGGGISRGWFIAFRVMLWSVLVLLIVMWLLRGTWKTFRYWRGMGALWLGLAWFGLVITLCVQVYGSVENVIYRSRNFYGVLTIYEYMKKDPTNHHKLLQHGTITHGIQFYDPVRAMLPNSYYGTNSGMEVAWDSLPQRPLRVGVVGLGTGTITTYGREGDYFRFYEINSEVLHLARNRFSYITNTPAKVDVMLGDARLTMEKDPPQKFDLLVVDAFSSDAIPVHLLTRQAFELYRKHLTPGAVLAVHVSNHYLNLEVVMARAAKHFGFAATAVDYTERAPTWFLYSSTWILLWPDGEVFMTQRARDLGRALRPRRSVPLWTDDYASLYTILK
jgi:spermidine synthase